ncbi:reactive intermediate/imine deaminase [Pseudomonas sp. S60]|uniref:RidA family protein n=1 Tax=unclassified Pseudomonas TaxID=196821 RepID=UPI0019145BF4|nr:MULTISPECIES: Rid family detoxifying hydrolase [unclassified Pseudomonas]MBK5005337.1 reactive intermediate/imine deaminase [Pseudomonas sp. S32]MBK5011527.1 reactive intermediate/imine deaminase [Pseudomonas sp. S60]
MQSTAQINTAGTPFLAEENVIFTNKAPLPLGTYSQGIKVSRGQTIYLSAQTPVSALTNEVLAQDFEGQLRQTLDNLAQMAEAAGGTLANVVKVTAFITDLSEFPTLNRVMQEYFTPPYPARTTAGASALARNTLVAIDAIMVV